MLEKMFSGIRDFCEQNLLWRKLVWMQQLYLLLLSQVCLCRGSIQLGAKDLQNQAQAGDPAIIGFTGCCTESIVNCVPDEYIVKDTRKKQQSNLQHVFNPKKLLLPICILLLQVCSGSLHQMSIFTKEFKVISPFCNKWQVFLLYDSQICILTLKQSQSPSDNQFFTLCFLQSNQFFWFYIDFSPFYTLFLFTQLI